MAPFLVMLALCLVIPLGWRGLLALWGPSDAALVPSYLPALEARRARAPFREDPIGELASLVPGIVTIGDSMAGRIQPERLGELSGAPVGPILQNATGSAYWYLVFKNYVVASGIKPKWVVFFFRDTNLTDPLFRLTGAYRDKLDEVARDREDELNRVVARRTQGPWHSVINATDALYEADRAREWVEPALTAWPARSMAIPRRIPAVLDKINETFALDKLRSIAQADLAAADDRDADFGANVQTSILPALLSLARAHQLPLVFVRVLRRPVDGAAPPESAALQKYAADLRAYLAKEGAIYLDDRDDPALAKLPYGDGDHISRDALVEYTDRFWARLSSAAGPRR